MLWPVSPHALPSPATAPGRKPGTTVLQRGDGMGGSRRPCRRLDLSSDGNVPKRDLEPRLWNQTGLVGIPAPLLTHLFLAWGGHHTLRFLLCKTGSGSLFIQVSGGWPTHPQSRPPEVLLKKQLPISGGRHPTPWVGQGMCAPTRSGGDSEAPSHLSARLAGFL